MVVAKPVEIINQGQVAVLSIYFKETQRGVVSYHGPRESRQPVDREG